MKKLFLYIPVFWYFTSAFLFGQIDLPDSLLYRLPDDSLNYVLREGKKTVLLPKNIKIFPKTLRIFYKGFFLKNNLHYRYKSKTGEIQLIQPFPAGDTLLLTFKKEPFPAVKNIRSGFIKKNIAAKENGDTVTAMTASGFTEKFENAFSGDISGLSKSGSFVRGFRMGSNQSLTLNSSLNLFLEGYITPQTKITAALTDENTPIQPEGNTQTLNEVDKVFIKVESSKVTGVMGDFDYTVKESQLDRLNRKLQGINFSVQTPVGKLSGVYASKRGNYHHNSFLGQEGNQGPYLLTGVNGERNIVVLAGTEKIYLNGKLLKRGENLDYVIDYTTGELTFTGKILISSESRIEADFEYIDGEQRYAKTLYGVRYRKKIGRGVGIKAAFYEEKDDINNYLADSEPLTAEEKAILRSAGNAADSAVVDGAVYVGPDNGYYISADTVINNNHYQYYKYDRENGDFTVRFSPVESGNGSYIRKQLGEYQFVGPGKGDYLPVVRIPLPQKHRMFVFGGRFENPRHSFITAELGVTELDRNYLSPLNDDNNSGFTGKLNWSWKNSSSLLKKGLTASLQGYYNFTDADFVPLDRYRPADYNRYWNLPVLEGFKENRWENTFSLGWKKIADYKLNLGKNSITEDFYSRRIRQQLSLNARWFYQRTFRESITRIQGNEEHYWEKTGGTGGIRKDENRFAELFADYEFKKDVVDNTHGGFEKYRFGVRKKWKWGDILTTETEAAGQDDYLFLPDLGGKTLKQAHIVEIKNSMNVKVGRSFKSDLLFNFRDKNFTEEFENYSGDKTVNFMLDPQFQDTTWQDRKSYSMQWRGSLKAAENFLINRWEYTAASELTAIRERVYVKVNDNLGNYRFDEELQEYVPDYNGDYILVIIPSGNYLPTSNVLFSWQTEWKPSRSRKGKAKRGWKRFVTNFRILNRIKIEEKTGHDNLWDIYLLNFSVFQQPAETIQGKFLWYNDLNFLPYHPRWNFRLTTRYQKQLANLYLDASGNEQRKIYEQSLIGRYRVSSHFKQEMELKYKTNERHSFSIPERDRDIVSRGAGLKSAFRVYKGADNILEFYGYRETDKRVGGELDITYFKVKERFTASLSKKGRGTVTWQWYRVIIDKNPLKLPLPFEMADGKKEGNSMEWSVKLDHYISSYLTFSLSYRGRKDPVFSKTVHTGLMEMRAFF